ncbi:unnamed protein product, partial [Amoebophrya sp. A120]|eukprot:GSA120T00013404001.1
MLDLSENHIFKIQNLEYGSAQLGRRPSPHLKVRWLGFNTNVKLSSEDQSS